MMFLFSKHYLFNMLISVLIAVMLMPGCSSKKDENTITFAGGGVGLEEQITREQIRLFEEKYNLKVDYKVMPNSATERHDKFVTHLSAGDASIDVYMIDIIWPAEFGAAGWIMPLDKYLTSVQKKDFIRSCLNGCTYQGKLYAIPWFVTTGLLYYRKDLLAKEKLQPPATWKQLIDQAQELSRKYNMDGFLWQGSQYEGLICDYLEFVWSNNGSVLEPNGRIKINTAQAREALNFMKDTLDKYMISPKGTTTYKEEDTRQIFQNGKAVFLRNWPYVWALAQSKDSKILDKVGVTTVPRGFSGKRGVGCLGGWNLAVSKYSKNPEAAYKFIAFMTAPEQQIYRAVKAGQAPSLYSAYKNTEVLKANPMYKDLVKAVEASKARPQTPFYSDLSEILQIYVSKALTGQLPVDQALMKAEEEIKKLVNKDQ